MLGGVLGPGGRALFIVPIALAFGARLLIHAVRPMGGPIRCWQLGNAAAAKPVFAKTPFLGGALI